MMLQFWCLNPMIAFVLNPQCYTFFPLFPYFATISLLKYFNKTYISFSGGIDSTVLLHLVRKIYPETMAVYIDTGLEYPELKQFVKSIDNVKIIKPKMNFRSVIKTYGYPVISKEVSKRVFEYRNAERKNKLEQSTAYLEFNGLRKDSQGRPSLYNKSRYKFLVDSKFLMSHKCCDIMKKNPAKDFEKESGLKAFVGTMADESLARLKVWKEHGCNMFDSVRPMSQPLSFWTKNDVLKYIATYNLNYAEVYGEIIKNKTGQYLTTGCERTGCIYCMYGCHLENEPNRFQKLKISHPNLWEYCMKDWDKGGLGMKEILNYINVKSE